MISGSLTEGRRGVADEGENDGDRATQDIRLRVRGNYELLNEREE